MARVELSSTVTLGGFFNEYIGLGVFANYSHYNKYNIHNLVAGPKLLVRYNHTNTNAFIFGWGLGYNYYQTTIQYATAYCGSFAPLWRLLTNLV